MFAAQGVEIGDEIAREGERIAAEPIGGAGANVVQDAPAVRRLAQDARPG